MRLADAPPQGWYPDPENRMRLRWWTGTDWEDKWRSPPPKAWEEAAADFPTIDPDRPGSVGAGALEAKRAARVETEEIVSQVRDIARSEVDRAAEVFGQRALAASREIQPLVTEYSSKFFRWIKIAAVIAVVLVVAWILFQVFVQASFFDWLGDRIDNLTDDESAALLLSSLR